MCDDVILFNRCHELFDEKDGVLFRKKSVSSNAIKGGIAGWFDSDKNPYYKVKIDKKQYLVHRVVFLMNHKFLPDFIDHIDGNTCNNKIENLRHCTRKENRWNCVGNKGSISGVKGVYYDRGRWKALVSVNNVRHYLGMFSTVEEAQVVVREKYKELQGEFSRYFCDNDLKEV